MKNLHAYLEESPQFIPAVVGYLVKDTRVLLGLRKKVSLGLGANLISGIGGKVGDEEEFKNETLEEALDREMHEEIGVHVLQSHARGVVRFIFPHKPKWNQEVHLYIIPQWEGEPKETEAIKPMWFPMNELPEKQMWEDNLYTIPLVLSGEIIEGIFLYNEEGHVVEHKLTVKKDF